MAIKPLAFENLLRQLQQAQFQAKAFNATGPGRPPAHLAASTMKTNGDSSIWRFIFQPLLPLSGIPIFEAEPGLRLLSLQHNFIKRVQHLEMTHRHGCSRTYGKCPRSPGFFNPNDRIYDYEVIKRVLSHSDFWFGSEDRRSHLWIFEQLRMQACLLGPLPQPPRPHLEH